MDVKSNKVQSLPLEVITKQVFESVNLNMAAEDSSGINILSENPHHEILDWLENKNLGKV